SRAATHARASCGPDSLASASHASRRRLSGSIADSRDERRRRWFDLHQRSKGYDPANQREKESQQQLENENRKVGLGAFDWNPQKEKGIGNQHEDDQAKRVSQHCIKCEGPSKGIANAL